MRAAAELSTPEPFRRRNLILARSAFVSVGRLNGDGRRTAAHRGELELLFGELATELRVLGVSADFVMVGGSWMLWHAQRSSTRDVDSGRRFETDLGAAVSRVAARHDLQPGWL